MKKPVIVKRIDLTDVSGLFTLDAQIEDLCTVNKAVGYDLFQIIMTDTTMLLVFKLGS